MSDEDKNFGRSLVLDFGKWWRHVKTIYWEIRTAKGDEFEPSSLKTIQRGLDRYLQEKNTGFSIIRDEDFANANKALDAKVKFLKKSGKGNKPNAAQPLSAEMIEEMWQKKSSENTTAKHSPMPISFQHFGFRGRQEHHQLKFGWFQNRLYKCRKVRRVVSGTTKENFSKWKEVQS